MSTTEQPLKARLVKVLRSRNPNWVIFRHEDIYTAGIPDISITACGKTLWVEVKALHFKGSGLQAQRMKELSQMGLAIYINFFPKEILILDGSQQLIASCKSKDYAFICDYIEGILDAAS